jgi:hypothetical protein
VGEFYDMAAYLFSFSYYFKKLSLYYISVLWRRFFEDCDSWGPENRSNNRLRFHSWLLLLTAQHQSWLQMMMWCLKSAAEIILWTFFQSFASQGQWLWILTLGGGGKTKLSCGEVSTHTTCKEWEGSFCIHGMLGFRV